MPRALHINRESRSFAPTHLTECFNCYWNFDIDILYVEIPFLGQIDAASKQLYDMRKRGLLDGVKHLGVDWEMGILCFGLGRRNIGMQSYIYFLPPACKFTPYQENIELTNL